MHSRKHTPRTCISCALDDLKTGDREETTSIRHCIKCGGLSALLDRLDMFKFYSKRELIQAFTEESKKANKCDTQIEEYLPYDEPILRRQFFENVTKVGKYYLKNSFRKGWLDFMKGEVFAFKPYEQKYLDSVINHYAGKFKFGDKVARTMLKKDLRKDLLAVTQPLAKRRIVIQPEYFDRKKPHFLYGSEGNFTPEKKAYYALHKVLFYASAQEIFLALSDWLIRKPLMEPLGKLEEAISNYVRKVKQPILRAILKVPVTMVAVLYLILSFPYVIMGMLITLLLGLVEDFTISEPKRKLELLLFKILEGKSQAKN